MYGKLLTVSANVYTRWLQVIRPVRNHVLVTAPLPFSLLRDGARSAAPLFTYISLSITPRSVVVRCGSVSSSLLCVRSLVFFPRAKLLRFLALAHGVQ